MAGSARYTAVLDANTLYPAPVRDVMLSLAVAGLYHARWSKDIEHEWINGVLASRPELKDRLCRTAQLMNRAIPDCMVTNYEGSINGLKLPDPNDRHVLAAAIAGHADAIVTFNLKDFPAETLGSYNIEAQHPDDFVMNQLELRELDALEAIKALRNRLRNPPQTAEQLIATLERCGLPLTAGRLRGAQGLI